MKEGARDDVRATVVSSASKQKRKRTGGIINLDTGYGAEQVIISRPIGRSLAVEG
jgi:hypothetical protein